MSEADRYPLNLTTLLLFGEAIQAFLKRGGSRSSSPHGIFAPGPASIVAITSSEA